MATMVMGAIRRGRRRATIRTGDERRQRAPANRGAVRRARPASLRRQAVDRRPAPPRRRSVRRRRHVPPRRPTAPPRTRRRRRAARGPGWPRDARRRGPRAPGPRTRGARAGRACAGQGDVELPRGRQGAPQGGVERPLRHDLVTGSLGRQGGQLEGPVGVGPGLDDRLDALEAATLDRDACAGHGAPVVRVAEAALHPSSERPGATRAMLGSGRGAREGRAGGAARPGRGDARAITSHASTASAASSRGAFRHGLGGAQRLGDRRARRVAGARARRGCSAAPGSRGRSPASGR